MEFRRGWKDFDVYGKKFRVTLTIRGLKVNRLDDRGKCVKEPPKYFERRDQDEDLTPAFVSAFIRREYFAKKIPLPEPHYSVSDWD